MPTIRFSTNVPVELHLRSIEGRPVESQFGGTQHMFAAEEGAFYVSETVGDIITRYCTDLGVNPGDLVRITKAEVSRGAGRKGIQWQVEAVLAPKPEPPSELETKLAASIALAEARKQPQQAPEMLPWQMTLLNQTKALTDVYAAALAHAGAMHGNAVKSDDVRTFVVTTFINATKNGANRNAA